MKKLFFITVLFSVVLFKSDTLGIDFSEAQKKAIVNNLISGLESDNLGVRTSTSIRVFEFIEKEYFNKEDFSPAVIPLMKMMRQGNTEFEKITAALSLYKIEDGRGIYLLGGLAKFEENDLVKKVTKNLYYNYHLRNDSTYLTEF